MTVALLSEVQQAAAALQVVRVVAARHHVGVLRSRIPPSSPVIQSAEWQAIPVTTDCIMKETIAARSTSD